MEKLKLVNLLAKTNGKRNLRREQKQWLSAQQWPITSIFKVFGNFQTPDSLGPRYPKRWVLCWKPHNKYNGGRTQLPASDFKSNHLPKMFFKEKTSVSSATSSGPFENLKQKFPRSDYVFSRSKHLQTETQNNENQVPMTSGFSSVVASLHSFSFFRVKKMITLKCSCGLSKGRTKRHELRKWNFEEWHSPSSPVTMLSTHSCSYILFHWI